MHADVHVSETLTYMKSQTKQNPFLEGLKAPLSTRSCLVVVSISTAQKVTHATQETFRWDQDPSSLDPEAVPSFDKAWSTLGRGPAET